MSLSSEMLLDTVLVSVVPAVRGPAVLGPPPTEDKVWLTVLKGSPEELASDPVWASGVPGTVEGPVCAPMEMGSISVTLVLETGSDADRAGVWLLACSEAEVPVRKASPAAVSACLVASGSPPVVRTGLDVDVATGRRDETVPCGLVSGEALEPGVPGNSTEVGPRGRESVATVTPAEGSGEVGAPATEDTVVEGVPTAWLPAAEPTARLAD